MKASRRRAAAAASLLLASAALVWGAGAAWADALAIDCSDAQSGEAIRFSYEGGDSGTLTVAGPFGTADLSAVSSASDQEVAGETIAVRGIRASGPASLQMPDRAALEQCIVKRRIPGEPADKDVDAVSAMACQPELKADGTPIAVDVDVSVALMDGELATLVMNRTYPEASTVTGDKLQLVTMAFGSFQCTVGK